MRGGKRKPRCHSGSHRRAHRAITPGERWQSQGAGVGGERGESKGGRGQVKRENRRERKWTRDGGRRGLKPGPQREVTVSMKLTLVTFGWIGCEAVPRFLLDKDNDFIYWVI